MDRGPLNSSTLKARFPEVYREFFSKCQLVVSAPHFFTWGGEYVGYFGGLMTMQKIPLRLYVGFEFYSNSQQEPTVEFASQNQAYSIKDKHFIKDQFEHLAQSRILEFIQRNIPLKNSQRSLKIHILSEIALGGTGSAGALCGALAVALGLAGKKITAEQVRLWDKTKSKPLLQNKKNKFNETLLLAWKLHAAYRGRENSAAPVITPLLNSQYPIFYQMKEAENLSFPLSLNTSTYDDLDHIDFIAGRLNDDLALNHHHSWPLDFGLIYLGEPKGTSPYTTEQLQDEMRLVDDFCYEHFNDSYREPPKSWEAGLVIMNFLSSQILYQLGQVLKSGSREDNLRALLRAIDKHQILFMLLGVLPAAIDSITSIIHHHARKLDDLGAGLKSVSTTKKDIILFVLPHGRARDAVLKQLPKLEKELAVKLHLGYASWLDGLEEDGCKIEQYLEEGIYSGFVSRNSVLITEFNGNGRTNSFLLGVEDFLKKRSQADLLIEETGKLYVKGQLLGSQELHSSKVTSEVLRILLASMGQEVSNRSLANSSYSLDRYEMQGKIISPLLKAFEQGAKKKLPINIKGSITDFSLKLDTGRYTIWAKEAAK
jgi:hypothetical protein